MLRLPRTLLLLLSFLALLVFASVARAETYDFVLRNGRVVDGTGKPAYKADVAVKDGRIAAVGQIEQKGHQEFDAAGLTVAPGFIDVHTHAEDIEDRPLAENFLRMGVTTLVLGNCGASVLNVDEFFRGLEELTISANVSTLIGHGTVRRRVMRGSFNRPPTPEELQEMQSIVRRAMEEGAAGLSTGLIYTPGVFAKTEELIELARIAAEYDGIYATHQRSEGTEIFTSLEEILRIARESRIRTQISHIKLSGPATWNQAAKVLSVIEQARTQGLDIAQDQYPYTASNTAIGQLIPDSVKDGGSAKLFERLDSPELKAACISEMKENLRKRQSPDYSYAVIASHHADPSLNGLNIAEAAQKLRGSASLDDQIETVFQIERAGGASAVFHGMSEPDVETFLRDPNTMIGSDSGVRKFQSGVPHPRGYGTHARILGYYTREKGTLRLEEAIRRMTSLPARTFRLKDRGELREGSMADIVVFDPEKISDHSTYKDPHHYATGLNMVFVNGVLVVKDDVHTGARPGMALRHRPVRTANAGAEK